MKNIVLAVSLLLLITSCNSHSPTSVQADTLHKKTAGIQYTCIMHPNVISNKPGTCPKCGMELVEKDASK